MDKTVLISRDSKDKIRIALTEYHWQEEAPRGFIIERYTGQFKGKMSKQPDILVARGKVNRTVSEQVKLEFNSIINKYKDKGYKEVNTKLAEQILDGTASEEDLVAIVPKGSKTDANGNKKPQLAKDFNKVTSNKTLNKPYYASRKLDGVRCHIFKKDGVIQTSSRGGKNYNFAAQYILEEPSLIELFENIPDLILDGELYIHGRPLQYISGTCRIEDWDPKKEKIQKEKVNELEFWIYDVVDESMVFEDRLSLIDDELITYFDKDENSKIKICEHILVEGWLEIEKYHNKFVTEGFEGLVLRAPDKEYKCNARDNRMIKVKMYQEDEFEIIGFTEGRLRQEDMTFKCVTKGGQEFDVKPQGTVEQRLEFLERMDEIVGKMATIKFFEYSVDNVPLQPSLKAIRDYE